MIITIDGPTASGKSTVAQEIAKELHLFYIASGLLFRALAYLLTKYKNYTPPTLTQATEKDIEDVLDKQIFTYHYDTKEHIFFNDHEITHLLKTSDIDSAASILGTNMHARQALLDFQRYLARDHNIIIDGRDCGSVVFPQAECKFYITASLEVRAQRWQKLQEKLGFNIDISQAQAYILERDTRDSQRTIAPLIIPENAIIIDSSLTDQYQTIKIIKNIINKSISIS